jgi:hypothetical protein
MKVYEILGEVEGLDPSHIMFKSDILLPNRLYVKAEEQRISDELYEALTKSFSIQKTIESIHWKLKCQTQKLLKDDRKSYYNCFAINGNIEDFDFQILLDILNLCGWYIAFIRFYNKKNQIEELKKNISIDQIKKINGATSFQLKVEAKFDVEIGRSDWKDELFCLAPLKVKAKIKKLGLVPKSGKNLDNQPDRIYLAFNKQELIRDMLPQLKRKDDRYIEGAILITVDPKNFNDKTRLFEDINWPDKAAYTLTNIPPYAITKIEDL